MMESRLPRRVRVIEVGPRDGFQMEERFIPTELKVEIVEALAASGLPEIEAVSFVHPKVIPQMRDAADVMEQVHRRPGVVYSALVPNLKGAERALEAGADALHVVICASETYNRKNVGLSVDESIAELGRIAELVAGAVPVCATLAVTFGCPFEGQLPDHRLMELAIHLQEQGIDELGLADSAGLGYPVLVRRILRRVKEELPGLPLRMHLHDTRGLGLANAFVALEEGVEAFDTSLGGLGGCPIMRSASGNIPTEDFSNMCHELRIATGVTVAGVCAASRRMQEFLERTLPSRVLAAGTRKDLYARNS